MFSEQIGFLEALEVVCLIELNTNSRNCCFKFRYWLCSTTLSKFSKRDVDIDSARGTKHLVPSALPDPGCTARPDKPRSFTQSRMGRRSERLLSTSGSKQLRITVR